MRSTIEPRRASARGARVGERWMGWVRRLLHGARFHEQRSDNVVPACRLEEARARREREAALLEDIEREDVNDLGSRDGSDPTGTGRI